VLGKVTVRVWKWGHYSKREQQATGQKKINPEKLADFLASNLSPEIAGAKPSPPTLSPLIPGNDSVVVGAWSLAGCDS